MYIITILEFTAQLQQVTLQVYGAVQRVLRLLAPGPGNWVTQHDLENLTSYGLRLSFRTLNCTAKAAKLRVEISIARDMKTKCDLLRNAHENSWKRPFGSWHYSCFFQNLFHNRVELEAHRITIHNAKRASTRTTFQNMMRREIQSKFEPYNAEDRMRHKMQRWHLSGPPGHLARRTLRNMATIGSACRPCVIAMFLRTLWNGWPTSARMRFASSSQGSVRTCVLLSLIHI